MTRPRWMITSGMVMYYVASIFAAIILFTDIATLEFGGTNSAASFLEAYLGVALSMIIFCIGYAFRRIVAGK